MKTIKLKYQLDYNIEEIQKEYSSVVRYCYNRFHDGLNQTEIRADLKENFKGLKLLNNLSFMKQNAIQEALGLYRKHKDYKIVFGSKRNLIKRQRGDITNEEWKALRLRSINIAGEKNYKGNRHFKLDIDNNQVIFKLNRDKHYSLSLIGLSKKRKKELKQLQELCEKKQHTFAVFIDQEHIRIMFESFKPHIKLKKDKFIGIDLNPSNIGISIIKDDKVVEVKEYNFSSIIDKLRNSKTSSDSKEKKYLNNKLKHELFEISNDISKMAKHHRCKFVFIEDLSSLTKKKNHNKGKKFNQLINNLWVINRFVSNLQLNLNEFGAYMFKVFPQYSSFIGNMKYNYSDAINSSIEIARRGYEVVIKKNSEGFYPNLTSSNLNDQWKDCLSEEVNTWKEFYTQIKNLGFRYRVSRDSLEQYIFKSKKSFVDLYLTKQKCLV